MHPAVCIFVLERLFGGRSLENLLCGVAFIALWWIPIGHIPSIDEAKKRIAHLNAYGPTQFAFDFKHIFEPDDEFQRGIDWSSFLPCPAT